MFDAAVMSEISKASQSLGLEPALMAAVVHVESGMRLDAMVNGRPEPLIRFEGHYFDRRLKGATRERARTEGLSSPHAGAIVNPEGQAARWRLLERAAGIDRRAAYESTSWGLGQVMGAHWAWLGYRNVEALVHEARSGLAGQLRLMARFIDRSGLADPLRRKDWVAFARGYNGPAFARNGYDRKLAVAYRRYAKAPASPATSTTLRLGMSGTSVKDLQQALTAAGFQVHADGIFGPRTRDAVRRFQAASGLLVDGIAGPATRSALEIAVAGTADKRSLPALFGLFGRLLAGFVKRHSSPRV